MQKVHVEPGVVGVCLQGLNSANLQQNNQQKDRADNGCEDAVIKGVHLHFPDAEKDARDAQQDSDSSDPPMNLIGKHRRSVAVLIVHHVAPDAQAETGGHESDANDAHNLVGSARHRIGGKVGHANLAQIHDGEHQSSDSHADTNQLQNPVSGKPRDATLGNVASDNGATEKNTTPSDSHQDTTARGQQTETREREATDLRVGNDQTAPRRTVERNPLQTLNICTRRVLSILLVGSRRSPKHLKR